jgi:hypothetical protein
LRAETEVDTDADAPAGRRDEEQQGAVTRQEKEEEERVARLEAEAGQEDGELRWRHAHADSRPSSRVLSPSLQRLLLMRRLNGGLRLWRP